jgi:hypothetical protein
MGKPNGVAERAVFPSLFASCAYAAADLSPFA